MFRRRPYIEKGNKVLQSYARVRKEMVIITSINKPMLRTSKGNVKRAGTLAIYSEEIEKL